jgi:L-alanine-DL-glutamate epimerase-like enolase superfamily enzyme
MMLCLRNAIDGVQQTAAMMEDDILKVPIPIADGPRWGLVEGPGLGIEVDEDKLHRYSETFRKHGQFLPYGT